MYLEEPYSLEWKKLLHVWLSPYRCFYDHNCVRLPLFNGRTWFPY